MRLLADENVSAKDVAGLRAAGHNVISITDVSPGISDAAVFARAAQEHRLLITYDRDFGELAFRLPPVAPAGVVLVRTIFGTPGQLAEVLIELSARPDFQFVGYFSVIERDRVRQRPLSS